MADSTNVETSLTLLRALQDVPRREEAWATFLARYQPLLEQWCRRWGLRGVDAEDALADLLVKLLDKGLLRHFDSTRPFRAWLQALVHNAVRDQQRRRQQRPGDWGRGGSDMRAQLEQVEDPEGELAHDLLAGMQRDLAAAQRIEAVVQGKVRARTWQAFVLRALEEVPAREVAERLGMSVASVHQARYSVGKLLQQEGAKAMAGRAECGEESHE
jgi:RNA polymerase sigma-70 factor (ECF subfamily)